MKKCLLLLIPAVFLLGLFIRLYQIRILPGEWYGDISNVHEYVMEIKNLDWPFYFLQSPGPFYHYLIFPLTVLFQHRGYETYKLASIVVSLIGLGSVYLMAGELAGRKIALLTILMMTFSLWYLVWSRLGNSQIVIPMIVSLTFWFYLRFLKKLNVRDLLLGGFISSLGWYTYPQTFILPVFYFCVVFYGFIKNKANRQWRQLKLLALLLFTAFIPFVMIVIKQTGGGDQNFSAEGYVGRKVLPLFQMEAGNLIYKTMANLGKTMLMLHYRGDGTFRVNITGRPMLDGVSGLLFLVGLVYLFRRRRSAFWLILAILPALSLPSLSPVLPDAEIPNSARTIALTPFVYLISASGLYAVFTAVKRKSTGFSLGLATGAIFWIAFSNLSNYFRDYKRGLPENNLAPSQIIADYLDGKVPAAYRLNFAECCWGDYGQPEPKGIYYSLRKPRLADYLKLTENCRDIRKFPAVVVARRDEEFRQKFNSCPASKSEAVYSPDGLFIANLYFLEDIY
ncbi:MAG: hypothetical protein UV73_C0005G0014 [Candidatus Gottesmanbacteria bacterium GW2011_GWA2_43_14]|uniref:Glycosyltransferase RgtA/B/C/D-like domain-containing protein n=1 Tax=Candidatus Gottesmanbacteria bacterium GW2011_GWA2_43_14 TaxID=1618443 RepID=A0A0G1DJI6_9BACT|nr:MAG: hypothetical protein UV73_C0005G0014 [Candidatus Gottesmanbacteria bacterium GW2011_GWA2_43_14]